MICGALQTLNEEAFEDVVASERPSPTGGPAGEMIANDINVQSKSQQQQQQPPLSQLQSQSQQIQPLTPIQENVEHERPSHAFSTERRQSSTQNLTTLTAANSNGAIHKSCSNHSVLSIDDRQCSTHSLSAPSSLSQSPLLHATPTILLTKSDERLNANTKLTSAASTVILMPNSSEDVSSSKYDRTYL